MISADSAKDNIVNGLLSSNQGIQIMVLKVETAGVKRSRGSGGAPDGPEEHSMNPSVESKWRRAALRALLWLNQAEMMSMAGSVLKSFADKRAIMGITTKPGEGGRLEMQLEKQRMKTEAEVLKQQARDAKAMAAQAEKAAKIAAAKAQAMRASGLRAH